MLGIQEMTVLSYLRNKCVWTVSQNLQVLVFCTLNHWSAWSFFIPQNRHDCQWM